MTEKLSDFTERHYIGGGRFSEIYKAKDPQSGQLVALKVTSPDEDCQPHSSIRELHILKLLNGKSKNIIQLIRSFKQDQFDLVMVLPYFSLTLDQYLKNNSKKKYNPYLLSEDTPKLKNGLPKEKADNIVKGIANGLDLLHSNQIIHRDIKPENIMFKNFEPIPVIIDLGISYQYPNNYGKELPNEKICQISTSIYKAPEAIFGISNYSYGLDIWSFGIVMSLIYSDNCEPILNSEEGYGDLRLVSLLFKTFGTPTLETWPEARQSTTFQRLQPTPTDPISINKILPQASEKIRELFRKMMIYESTQRISAKEIYASLE